MDLPTEIRLEIYGHLYHGFNISFSLEWNSPPHIHIDDTYHVDKIKMICGPKPGTKHQNITAILPTFHRIYDEALPVLYEETCFRYDVWYYRSAKSSPSSPGIGYYEPKLEFIKNVDLRLDWSDSP